MKKKFKYTVLVFLLMFLMTGCTTYLKDKEGKAIVNPTTGQSLTENILCRPTDEETLKLYEEAEYDLSNLPSCVCDSKQEDKKESSKENQETEDAKEKEETTVKDSKKEEQTKEDETKEETTVTKEEECREFSIFSGKYEGLWTSIFVKPLAYIILFFGKITGKFGLGLIITSILIRLVMYPLTKKSTVQAEKMKEIQPELNRLEKKYANKDQNDREVMMQKSQEMMMIYKKYNISPMSGCLPALLQLPLLMAFLDAINRVPAIFEEMFLGLHLGTSPKVGITSGNWLYIILTILVAVTTFYSLTKAQNNTSTGNEDMMKQTKTMMNVMTIMIIVMSIFMSSALNIYWIVSNGITMLQNYLVKRSMK